ncbi:MAG: acetyl-CoA carboxylase biotin carboxylase subunit [Burkholderiales bacterium]|nr:acetyl-CoA carboxylase biotin carboxylase subunit [Burkholderiales bacterium]
MTLARVLIANRGEIAVRIIRACHALGLETVLAASEADRESLPARLADRTVCIGPPQAARSYLDARAIVTAALLTHSDAVHPGYGFLAESAQLAQLCADHGVTFVGPTAEQIRCMGNKLTARAIARRAGLPVLPGSRRVGSPAQAAAAARRLGYPVMLKAAAGGGGRGMKLVNHASEMPAVLSAAAAEARSAFGDSSLYLERYIGNARHVEVQVLGDRFGSVVHLGERDCSLQRRHQKLVEEAPAPAFGAALRRQIRAAGARIARHMGYRSAGTVEFIVDQDAGAFHFLEMNTRIQVEHPVTEMITGIDLVQEQLRIAAGERLRISQREVRFRGHAIECRINAERPEQDFRPDPGRIDAWRPPQGPDIRLDSHCHAGYTVPIHYDSLLGKLIVRGETRAQALRRMRAAIRDFRVSGIETTLPFLQAVLSCPAFAAGRVNTRLLEEFAARYAPPQTVIPRRL